MVPIRPVPAPLLHDDAPFRAMLGAIPDLAVYMLDTDGIIIAESPGAQNAGSREPSNLLGRHAACLLTEADRSAGLPEHALATAAQRGKFETETWRLCRDGRRWTRIVLFAVRAPAGALRGFALVCNDQHDRKTMENTLRVSEEQYRLLVQRIADCAIFFLDPAGRVTEWNLGAERIKGYALRDIIGTHVSRFYTAEDVAAGLPEAALATAAREGRCSQHGWRVRQDGSRFWADSVYEAIRAPDGTLTGFAEFTRDRTEERRAQQALIEAREALLQAQKMEAIGRLSAGVAHDFNNILQSIIGALELVKDELAEGTPAQAYGDMALKAAIRGSSLTNHLLSYARKQLLVPQAVALGPFLNETRALLARTLGIQIAVEVAVEGQPFVHVDPGQLQTALLNLAINAAHAMPQGGTLRIRTAEESDGRQGWVRLHVSDTGMGMDAPTLARSVEPFFTTKGANGSGLGLSMVQGFVEQSGGLFRISSAPGQGTAVELRLPAAMPAPTEDTPAEGGRRVHAGRILLVDDAADVLATMGTFLERAGFEVLRSGSAEHALGLFARHMPFSALVTDYAMPGRNGLELIAAARGIQPCLPAVLITGFAEISLAANAMDCAVVLHKPVQRKPLIDALLRVTKRGGDEPAAPCARARPAGLPLPWGVHPVQPGA